MDVVGSVLRVGEGYDAVLVGGHLLVEGALVVPDVELGTCYCLLRVERVHLLDRRGRGLVGHGLLVVIQRHVLPRVFERDSLLGNVERVAVFCLGLVYRVGAEVELRRRRLAVLARCERCHDLALMGAYRAVRRLDRLCRLHDVDGFIDRISR